MRLEQLHGTSSLMHGNTRNGDLDSEAKGSRAGFNLLRRVIHPPLHWYLGHPAWRSKYPLYVLIRITKYEHIPGFFGVKIKFKMWGQGSSHFRVCGLKDEVSLYTVI